MKKIQQKPKDEQTIDILKRLVRRIEDAAVDIHDMRFDLKSVKLRLSGVEHNTQLMKIDIENMKVDMEHMKADMGELGNKIDGVENRLNRRIEHVADLITVEFGGKLQNNEKRIKKLEYAQQAA